MGNSVSKYIKADVKIFFEPDHVACDYCPLLETYSRKQCRKTGEYLVDTRFVGAYCPLEFEEE